MAQRLTTQPRRARILAPAVGLIVVVGAAACGSDSKPKAAKQDGPPQFQPAKADIERAKNRQTFVGRVDGTDAYVALDVTPDRPVRAYVCDSKQIKQWFSGALSGDTLQADADAGAGSLSAARYGDTFTGTVQLAGTSHTLTAARSQYPAGLYLAGTRSDQGDIRGAWIVLADGSRQGAASKQGKPVDSTLSPDTGEATVGGQSTTVVSGGSTGIQPLRKTTLTKQQTCDSLESDYKMYDSMAAGATDPAIKKHFEEMRLASLQMAVNAGCFAGAF